MYVFISNYITRYKVKLVYNKRVKLLALAITKNYSNK